MLFGATSNSNNKSNPMRTHWNFCFIWTFFVTILCHSAEFAHANHLETSATKLDLALGDRTTLNFTLEGQLSNDLIVELEASTPALVLTPWNITFPKTSASNVSRTRSVEISTRTVSSNTFIDVKRCYNRSSASDSGNGDLSRCPFNNTDVYIRVRVVHSRVTSALVIITGWIYFFAWSISFYPQIILNFQRRSVTGLNFDFLLLNVIGFTCYTIYNILLYFDSNVQAIYEQTHARSLIPVLLNDVVFAAHALLACIITGVQCFIYERGPQRVSYVCWGLSSILITFSVFSLIASICSWLNWLQFINYLSYVKMTVTLCKYFPQAILNFRRQSTVGWSIGNVLLDFSGGFMDICQMVLQAENTDDWSAFYGNPVKFGLGMVSMIFDVVFMLQHYVLYRGNEAVFHRHISQQSEYAPSTVQILAAAASYDQIDSGGSGGGGRPLSPGEYQATSTRLSPAFGRRADGSPISATPASPTPPFGGGGRGGSGGRAEPGTAEVALGSRNESGSATKEEEAKRPIVFT